MANLDYPEPIIELISQLKRLPGIGPRSAERIAVWLIQNKKSNSEALSEALTQARHGVHLCKQCGFFATADSCAICDDDRRDSDVLCVVEQPTDVLPLERSGAFQGYYHCLGGKLSPLDNTTPDDLNVASLQARISSAPPQEIILALSSDVEGEATANYLSEILAGKPIRVTRIAQGLPAGGGLEHADELTLLRALQGRR